MVCNPREKHYQLFWMHKMASLKAILWAKYYRNWLTFVETAVQWKTVIFLDQTLHNKIAGGENI